MAAVCKVVMEHVNRGADDAVYVGAVVEARNLVVSPQWLKLGCPRCPGRPAKDAINMRLVPLLRMRWYGYRGCEGDDGLRRSVMQALVTTADSPLLEHVSAGRVDNSEGLVQRVWAGMGDSGSGLVPSTYGQPGVACSQESDCSSVPASDVASVLSNADLPPVGSSTEGPSRESIGQCVRNVFPCATK